MKKAFIIPLLLILLILFGIDIFVRIFNNISSPVISLLGFIGVIVTILLTVRQMKHQQGSNFLSYYREHINKLANATPQNNSNVVIATSELLQFPIYTWSKFEDLKLFPAYLEDLKAFQDGVKVNSSGKPYDAILGNVRLFHTALLIQSRNYISLIKEIESHNVLDSSQKQLLLKDLFDSQVEKYYNACWLVDNDPELQIVKSDLYMAFTTISSKEQLRFFNNKIYELKRFIDGRPDLIKLTVATA
jgi:hypothetical protein